MKLADILQRFYQCRKYIYESKLLRRWLGRRLLKNESAHIKCIYIEPARDVCPLSLSVCWHKKEASLKLLISLGRLCWWWPSWMDQFSPYKHRREFPDRSAGFKWAPALRLKQFQCTCNDSLIIAVHPCTANATCLAEEQLFVVIIKRVLGFEPVTHSLWGFISLQFAFFAF